MYFSPFEPIILVVVMNAEHALRKHRLSTIIVTIDVKATLFYCFILLTFFWYILLMLILSYTWYAEPAE